jgi:hypothetical protein
MIARGKRNIGSLHFILYEFSPGERSAADCSGIL